VSERPPAEVSEFGPDNRVPEMDAIYGGLWRQILGFGLRRLLLGRPRGRSRLTRYHSVWGSWVGLIGGPVAAGALWAWIVPWPVVGMIGLSLGAGLSFAAVLVAAAVDATVPPPTRPFCQSDKLGAFFPYYARSGLVEVVPDQLWVAQVPLVFHGVQMGTRMSLVRIGSDALLVYSPVPLEEEDLARVRALGQVRWIVAPNVTHHLFVAEWLRAFPDAQAWAAPGLAARRPDVRWSGTLTTDGVLPWDRALMRLQVLEGHHFHQEVVLFHEPSRSLLVADAVTNVGHAPETGPMSRFLVELFGMAGRPTPPTDLKWTWGDREALARAASQVAAWPFDRIVLAHGRLIDVQARKVWRDAYAFVLQDP